MELPHMYTLLSGELFASANEVRKVMYLVVSWKHVLGYLFTDGGVKFNRKQYEIHTSPVRSVNYNVRPITYKTGRENKGTICYHFFASSGKGKFICCDVPILKRCLP